MQALQSPYRLATVPSSTSDQKLASEVLQRFATAEYLDLQEEDFIAINGEAVQTSQFLAISNKDDYQRAIGLQPVSAYWGYKGNADMTSLDEGAKRGLVFIKEQFLPPSELSFAELLDLLRSPFLRETWSSRCLTALQSLRVWLTTCDYAGSLMEMARLVR
jgi:hypothetical protein